MTFISIIIPTYNAAATLEKTLAGIYDQSFKDYEVVVMDGLSTDRTLDIINGYTSKTNVRYISGKDEGIYDAMNKGIKIATGRWLYFLGGDDILADYKVLENMSSFLNPENQIVYGNVRWVPSGNKESGEWGYSRFLNANINHQRIFYRADLFQEYGNFNTIYKVSSDHELNIRFFCNTAVKKKYVDIDIANYNETGFSANKIDELFWNNWKPIVYNNFSPFLSSKEIYKSLSWYCWYNMRHKKYWKAFKLFCAILFKTEDLSFIKHSLSQLVKTAKR